MAAIDSNDSSTPPLYLSMANAPGRSDSRYTVGAVIICQHRVSIAACLALAFVLVTGCSKREKEQAGPSLPPPISEPEGKRGAEACTAYRDKICACADTRPDDAAVGEACQFAKAKVSSLNMALRVNRSPKDATEAAATERTARNIMRSCFEEVAKLAPSGCPRSASITP